MSQSPGFRGLSRDLQRLLYCLVDVVFRRTNIASGTYVELYPGADDGFGGYAGVFNGTGNVVLAKFQTTALLKNTDSSAGGIFFGTGTSGTSRWQVSGTGHVLPAADNSYDLGSGAARARVLYAATGTINTSDERSKDLVGSIPNEWLDAWADVQWSRFKFKDAIALKGDNARWHLGLVAQAVVKVFSDHGIDATQIGLVCFDAWEESEVAISETETISTPAGDRWGLRYDMAFALEAALTRRRLAALEAK